MPYTYEFPKHDLTATVIAYNSFGTQITVLGIIRKDDPFKGRLALPGGFKELNETIEQTARRELLEEVPNLREVTESFHGCYSDSFTFSSIQSDPDRDPRSKTSGAPVVDTVWSCPVSWQVLTSGLLRGGSDATSVVCKVYDQKDFLGRTAGAYAALCDEWAFDHGKSLWIHFDDVGFI